LATILRQIPAGGDVLDVGCAEGYLAAHLPGNRVWGLDGNPTAIARARVFCAEAAIVDLNDLPATPLFRREFGTVVLADVLEHLVDPEATLRHFKEYIGKSGRVIVSLPNVALWRCRLNLLFGRFDYQDYGVLDRTHLHLYTFKTALELLRAAGYRPLRVQGAANLLGPVAAHVQPLRNLASIHIIITAAP